jgi:ammonia channel protein AmtB
MKNFGQYLIAIMLDILTNVCDRGLPQGVVAGLSLASNAVGTLSTAATPPIAVVVGGITVSVLCVLLTARHASKVHLDEHLRYFYNDVIELQWSNNRTW